MMLFILGVIHLKLYYRYLVPDELFIKWENKHCCIDKVILCLATMINFKVYRILHSKLLDRDEFSINLMSVTKLIPFSIISICSLILCSLPIVTGSSLALYYSTSNNNEYFAALDCLTVSSIMFLLIILDLKHESTYFIREIESENIKRQMYEEDDIKLSFDGDSINPLNEKNYSKE